jgi:hypothetical protein
VTGNSTLAMIDRESNSPLAPVAGLLTNNSLFLKTLSGFAFGREEQRQQRCAAPQ